MAAADFKGSQEEHADGIVEDRKKSPPIYFNILFYGLILWAAIFCAYFLFSGWSSGQEFQEKMEAHTSAYQQTAPQNPVPATKPQTQATATVATQQTSAPIDPKALFAAKCAGCHGADGKGSYGPDLSDEYKFGKTPEAIITSISDGREGKMPAFSSQLSADEIKALADFLLQL